MYKNNLIPLLTEFLIISSLSFLKKSLYNFLEGRMYWKCPSINLNSIVIIFKWSTLLEINDWSPASLFSRFADTDIIWLKRSVCNEEGLLETDRFLVKYGDFSAKKTNSRKKLYWTLLSRHFYDHCEGETQREWSHSNPFISLIYWMIWTIVHT